MNGYLLDQLVVEHETFLEMEKRHQERMSLLEKELELAKEELRKKTELREETAFALSDLAKGSA